ncbi:GDSL-type esterase/lipase family protein [Kitasatospora sp. NPDC057198]|uniref:GDSL-type esterase/lipase family protein n=1 Tax=Kitasatospora sp. NPDC057198 TaxID=3346046 RepID=UPI003638A35B
MTSSSSLPRKGLAALAAAVCVAGVTGLAPAHAAGVREPAADAPWVVSLGDSFISGEAGRWAGNSNEPENGWSGTDRAYDPETGESDPAKVYGASYEDGCNRSDVAEVHSLTLDVRKLNLACSGATSTAVKLPENGGKPFKGEPSQAEQLQKAVTGQPVRAVVVSIGGNDLGFSDIIAECTKQFLKPFGGSPCAPDAEQQVKDRLPGVRTAVVETLADVRTALKRAGHRDGSYRLVLQSYPSPLPDAARVRYPGEKYDRLTEGGCPFFDKDLTWAHDDLVPQISAAVAEAAHEAGAEFLDLSRAFEGREVCSAGTRHADLEHPPSGKTSEWMRFLTTGAGQGQLQESLHPNRYGQQALGTCLGLQLEQPAGDHRCVNTPGRGPAAMALAASG